MPENTENLYFVNNNGISIFDTNLLTNNLIGLYLNDCSLTSFTPNLPQTIISIELDNNNLNLESYNGMETWANNLNPRNNITTIRFVNNIDSVSGTNLRTILISKNFNVIAQ